MPENKRIQGPEATFCPLLYVPEEQKPAAHPLLRDDGKRRDGRKCSEIRPLFIKTGTNSQATGSAYLELGSTKVICAVHGPKEIPRREDQSLEKGRIVCEFKFAPFSCLQRKGHQQDQEEKEYSTLVVQALQRVILASQFPKLQLEINILVLENGGNALCSGLLCAGLALSEGGVELLDLPVACAVTLHASGEFFVDPSSEEECMAEKLVKHPGIKASVMAAYLPALDEVSTIAQHGVMRNDQLLKGIELCVEASLRIQQRVRAVLTEDTSTTEE